LSRHIFFRSKNFENLFADSKRAGLFASEIIYCILKSMNYTPFTCQKINRYQNGRLGSNGLKYIPQKVEIRQSNYGINQILKINKDINIRYFTYLIIIAISINIFFAVYINFLKILTYFLDKTYTHMCKYFNAYSDVFNCLFMHLYLLYKTFHFK